LLGSLEKRSGIKTDEEDFRGVHVILGHVCIMF
jgi:hypothetical protein